MENRIFLQRTSNHIELSPKFVLTKAAKHIKTTWQCETLLILTECAPHVIMYAIRSITENESLCSTPCLITSIGFWSNSLYRNFILYSKWLHVYILSMFMRVNANLNTQNLQNPMQCSLSQNFSIYCIRKYIHWVKWVQWIQTKCICDVQNILIFMHSYFKTNFAS